MSQPSPLPSRIDIPQATITDLRERLSRVRWADEPPGAPWSTGASVGFVRDLVDYWRDGFDWRAQEARLNEFRHLTVPISGIDLHFIHQPGQGPDPMPLLISHGWPGSIVEFVRLLPMLTDPARFGGDPADAFTVVAPALPGYPLSFKPGQKRFGVVEIAETFASLMTDVLGYRRFAAQGGDWGAFITSRLGYQFAERMIGIHITLLSVRRDPSLLQDPTPEEKQFLGELNHWLKEETGYQWIQGTKPTTLAVGLNDSPAGLAAWIAEKFHRWTDNDGTIESAVPRDEMLANIMLYWATGAIGASFWPYYARMHSPWPIPDGERIMVPTGYAEFPREILRPPRSLAERSYGNIQRWTRMAKGGHFAALEQTEALASEIRTFFRPLRQQQRA
ncbi:MAG: epoxide hydrolase [Hyphomicrobiaceae bacterium]|nr:epoxide hydrolase [Hyphomicrobiaceae bacterium]